MSSETYGDQGTTASERLWQRRMEKAQERLPVLEHVSDILFEQGRELLWIKLIWQASDEGSILAILKCNNDEGAPEIAFVGGLGPVMTLAKLTVLVREDKLTWKADQYHDGRGE